MEDNDFELQVVGMDDRRESPWESRLGKSFSLGNSTTVQSVLHTILELATRDARCPLNLSAWKIAFRSQSDQYIQSPKRVMLKGCLSISGEERTILEKIRRKFGIFLSPHEIVNKLFSAEKKPAAATLPNDGTMGMMQRPKRLSILTTCKTCLLSIKEHLLNLLTQRNNLQKKKKKKTRKQLCMSLEKIQYSWAFQPSKKVFSIGLYLVGKRQENLSKEAKK